MSEVLVENEESIEECTEWTQSQDHHGKEELELALELKTLSEENQNESKHSNVSHSKVELKQPPNRPLLKSNSSSPSFTSNLTLISKFKNSFKKNNLHQEKEGDDTDQTKEVVTSFQKTNRISSLTSESTLRLCANQVIIDLATAIKEVLENAIDSGATRIELKIKQHGLEGFQISDNGSGIHPDDYETVAKRHATSKLNSFEGLDRAYSETFGFRGEALSSLCALAQVSILTCTQAQEPLGRKLDFHYDGQIRKVISIAAKKGTTVFVTKLFEQIPVRSTEFIKNAKREFAKAVELLQQYAVGCTQCRISCWHLVSSGNAAYKSNLLFATNLPFIQSSSSLSSNNGFKTLKDNLISIFGSQGLSDMPKIHFTTEDSVAQLDGYITQGPSRSSSDRQYLFLHGRPVDIPKISRCINQAYKIIYPSYFPVFAIDIKISPGHYDLNVTPDKRTVLIANEESIIEEFKTFFENFFDPSSTQVVPQPYSQTLISCFQPKSPPVSIPKHEDPLPNLVDELQIQTPMSQRVKKRLWSFTSPQSSSQSFQPSPSNLGAKRHHSLPSTLDIPSSSKIDSKSSSNTVGLDSYFLSSNNASPSVATSNLPVPCAPQKSPSLSPSDSNSLHFLEPISKAPGETCAHKDHGEVNRSGSPGIENTMHEGEEEVDTRVRTLTKLDFQAMKIHGQFNLGFILVSLNETDLFIVDQHASDEKYKYEQLLLNMHVDRQPLLHPISLLHQLSPMDIETLSQYRKELQKQGFTVDEALQLITVPLLQGDALGVSHLTHLLHQLQDTSKASLVVLDEIKAVFASKACRSSIMIGTSLELKTMLRILQHLSTLHQPWVSSPYGPTPYYFLFIWKNIDIVQF
ncbi:ATP-binding mismatch repair protein [Coelomomyces lativittatus]|nr:ATP-binding mismatch repair protein [Coelomomyces lativittatus]